MLQREIVVHWQLRHKNVLGLTGIFWESEDDAPMMLVPLMKHGSAGKYLQTFGFRNAVQFSSVVMSTHLLVLFAYFNVTFFSLYQDSRSGSRARLPPLTTPTRDSW